MNINAIGNIHTEYANYNKYRKDANNSVGRFAINDNSLSDTFNSEKNTWSGDMVITLDDKLRGVSYGNPISHRSKDEMTMDEYKQWFMNETNHMPISGWMQSNFSSATVVIKDEAFERMKKDPEYEEYVLNRIRSYYSASGLNTGMNNIAYEVIGASPEECHGYAGPVGGSTSKGITGKEKSWWEKRHEKMEKLIREQTEISQRKRIAKREVIQREYNNSRTENERRMQPLKSEQAANVLPTIGQMEAAAIAYEANFIKSDLG